MFELYKVYAIVLLFTSLIACDKEDKFEKDNYNIVIKLSLWSTFDFNSGEISSTYPNFEKTVNIELSTKEKLLIKDSFFKNKIDTYRGKHKLGQMQFPSGDAVFSIYQNDKINSVISIHYDYHKEDVINDKKASDIVDFRDMLLTIFENKPQYKQFKSDLVKQLRVDRSYQF